MPNENTDTASKLKKLGERVRQSWVNRHPIPEQSLDTVQQTVREEWQREQTQKRGKPIGGKAREPKPPEPER